LQRADFAGKGTGEQNDEFDRTEALLEEILSEDACLTVKDLAIDGKDLMDLGFAPGPELGNCLSALLEQVLDEKIPNEREALLQEAKNIL